MISILVLKQTFDYNTYMDTKEKILNTSEIMFANKGFESVSIREIVKAAEVNIAAINYHFGSKEDLIFSVLERRILKINKIRLLKLKELRSSYPKTIPLKEILKAFVGPVFDLGRKRSGSSFMLLMGRIISNANPNLKEKIFNLFDEVVREFLPEIIKSTKGVDPHVVACRFYFSVGSMAHTLMNHTVPKELSKRMGKKINLDDIESELIDFLLGGLSAK